MKTERMTVEQLRALLSYDPVTGIVTWIKRPAPRASKVQPGAVAGCVNNQGYVVMGLQGRQINVHQVAWALHYGEWATFEIDHKNCNKADNRISNLRAATNSLNHANVGLTKSNTSGRKGVTWNKKRKKWQAGIRINGRQTYLGLFDDIEQAHAAYVKAANQNFEEFARTV